MKRKSLAFLLVLMVGLTILVGGCGSNKSASTEETYPTKPITWIVPFGSGGGSDQFARMMEKQIEKISDTEIVVVNVPGSKTAVGLNQLMKKEADGYTVFGATTDSVINLVTGVSSYSLDEIEPVAKVQHNVDMWFIRQNDKRFSTFQEVIDYAKQHPGKLSIGTTGLNGADALAIHQIEQAQDIKLEIVPFSEPGERYAALAGGHVDILHEQPGDVLSFIKSDKYKPIISMTKKRVSGFKDVPTTVKLGMQDLTAGYWRGVWVKAGTPKQAVNHLTKLIKQAVNTKEYKEYEKRKYLHLRKGLAVDKEAEDFLQKEYDYYEKVIK